MSGFIAFVLTILVGGALIRAAWPGVPPKTPAGVSIAGLPPTATTPAGSSEHDARCISLTDSEFNRHCDCELLRTLDAGGAA